MILGQCKGVHCVDLGESFRTHIFLLNFASIQPRTNPVKFAASRARASRLSRATATATSPRLETGDRVGNRGDFIHTEGFTRTEGFIAVRVPFLVWFFGKVSRTGRGPRPAGPRAEPPAGRGPGD